VLYSPHEGPGYRSEDRRPCADDRTWLYRGARHEFKAVRQEFKADLADLREEFKGDMIRLRGDIDIMLDRHIGTFRKDYDELAERVKRLEQLVLK
jgi:hypothetical protein